MIVPMSNQLTAMRMRVQHQYRLPRKLKKFCKKRGTYIWFEYNRFVAEEFPYPPRYNTMKIVKNQHIE